MNRREGCASDFQIDLLLAADLPRADEQRVREHLDDCSRCASRFASLREQREAFDVSGPPLHLPKPERAAARARLFEALGAALAGAALLLIVFAGSGRLRALAGRSDPQKQTESVGTRAKGGEIFELYVRHGTSIRAAGARERVYPGDQLQFAYSSAHPGHVAVLSRDGSGAASVYFPAAGALSWPAQAGREELLPESTILDDTPGLERVYAFFCAEPLELEPFRQRLARGEALAEPQGCSVRIVELDKRVGP